MNFCYRLRQALFNFPENLFQAHLVHLGIPGLFAESAEFAAINTNIRIVDMLINNVIGLVAVAPLPDDIRQIPHSQKIGAAIQGQPLVKGQPLLGQDLLLKRH